MKPRDAASLHYEVLVDRRENPRKCTVLPLEGRAGFGIVRFDMTGSLPSSSASFLLHLDGPPLHEIPESQRAAAHSIAVIDCNWHRLPALAKRIAPPLPPLARIPDGFVTAYPRRNKDNKDPDGGLATIEAIFIAAAFVGVWDETLFSEYHFGQAFLDLNRATFARYGVTASLRS